MPEIRTRPARPDEIAEVGRMWRAMYDYQAARGMALALRDDATEIWTRQLAGRLDSPVSVILVAESPDDAGLAGFLAAQIKRLPPHLAADKAKVGFVSEVFVDEAARRHHVGAALFEAALAWFRAADVGSVELQVVHGNDVAQQFWTRMGFQPELLQMRRKL
jgi:GNAT superfamily N-acetyltransferase